MIKFFRRFRQKLISENLPSGQAGKFSKYLLYAIGEIVLVMIGILLALQVNNWNENKKKSKIGKQYLTEMRAELEVDIKQLDFFINDLKKSIKNQEAALNTKDISKLSIDSLSKIISSINLDFKTSELTYNKMNNLGITKLSNNDSLNLRMTKYYNNVVVNLKLGMNFIFNDLVKRTNFYFYEQNKIDINSLYSTNREFPSLYNQTEEESERELKSNIVEFIYSIKGKNLVMYNLNGKKYSLKLLIYFQQETIKLLKAVYDELKTYNPKINPLPTLPALTVDLD
tara:strand:+ start:946 stop:1797 length:852 start_codon:yes stop_codon:yes gene_type:complete